MELSKKVQFNKRKLSKNMHTGLTGHGNGYYNKKKTIGR